LIYGALQFWIAVTVAIILVIAVVRLVILSKISASKNREYLNSLTDLEQVIEHGIALRDCATVKDIVDSIKGIKCWLYDSHKTEFVFEKETISNSQFKVLIDKNNLNKVAPIYLPDGEVVGFLEAVKQSTNLVYQADLTGSAIASIKRRQELIESICKLKDSEQSRSKMQELQQQFISNVSHELRTPLTSIKAYSEALTTPGAEPDSEIRTEFLSIISQESNRLDSIIGNLLNFSRLEREQVVLNSKKTDLVALVKGIEGTVLCETEPRGIDFELRCSDLKIELVADPDLLRQMVRHLLDNALKFTPDGGKICLTVSKGVTSVRLSVEDNGIGVPDNELSYLFDRFYQVDGSSTRKHGGQGIGLSICKEIVNQHEGRIWGEKISPAGMRFNIVLPEKSEVHNHNNAIGDAIYENQKTGYISNMLHWIAELMRSSVVSIMLPENDHLLIAAAIGLTENTVQDTKIRIGEGVAGKAWQSGKSILLNGEINDRNYKSDSALSVPMYYEGEVVGVVNVTDQIENRRFTEYQQLLLESVAGKLVSSLSEVAELTAGKKQFSKLQETLQMAVAVRRAKSDSISEECKNICFATAQRMKLSDNQTASLAMALQVYDLGMSSIPEPLLQKTGALHSVEWEMIRGQIQKSCDHAQLLGASNETIEIIRHSHERYNGSGYPKKMSGKTIPAGSRLLAVTDALTAMLQGRPWQKAKSLADALAEIDLHTGDQFCPEVVSNLQAEIIANGFVVLDNHSSSKVESR
jgi:signal transduction histidine kinase/HD-GYP domain-containing protein (c-di-GMP phosphodiesterase class II)